MRNAFYGLMLIVILRFRPEGLFPERYRYTLPAGAQSAGAQSAGAQSAGGTFQLAPLANAGDRAVTLAGADLHKNFGGIVAANGADLDLPAGQVTDLIAPNSADKTTANRHTIRVGERVRVTCNLWGRGYQ